MIDPIFLKQLDQFKLAMKKKTSSIYSGEQESREMGHGLVFKDFREYIPGDDIRYIDWKVYARTNKFYIKNFEEEREMSVHIILDASHSMDFGNPQKFEYAAKIGLGIVYLAAQNNQKTHFSLFSKNLETLKTNGKSSILKIINRLNSTKPKHETRFSDALLDYDKKIKSKSMVIIISDFLFEIPELENVLLKLKRNDIVLVQILDQKERLLQFEGDTILKDSETNLLLRTYISERLRKKYVSDLNNHINEIESTCRKLNMRFLTTTNNIPFFETFFQVFRIL